MREGWEIKTLADLFDIGSSKRVYESQWRNSGVPFYRAREIVKLSREGFVDNELFIDEDLYNEYANKYGIPKCGDIMVTGVGTLGVCYIVKENDKFYFKDGNTLWFKTKKGTNPFFVNYAFKSYFLRQQIDNCNGATVGTLTIVRAKQIIIPVPPLSEQQRIVSELDLLSSIIEKKKAQLKEYEQLAQSIFYDMFGDPVTNEKGWEVKKLGEVYKLKSGEGLSAKQFVIGKYPVYGGNGVSGYHNAYNMDGNYIIIGRVGAYCGNVRNVIGKFWLTDNAFQLIYDFEQQHPVFVKYVLTNLNLHQYANHAAQPVISNVTLKEIRVLFPPLSLQQSFAEKIEAIEQQKALIQQSITETESLFNSRMDYYFN